VNSMSENWRAFCTRGYDPAASITLDTLPGAFMVEALSARVFGFSTWSILLPQVVETVVAILVLYGVVRRWLGPAAGLFAAAAFATTPIVAALAHAEISDTLLTLLLILAADACLRAVAGGRLGWLLLAGVWVGLAFQTKMVEAWGVLPALALVYLLAAPGRMRRRLGHVLLAGFVTFAVSMSWIVMVLLTPPSARPYVDGSLDNSPLAMVFEYNLLSRYGVGSDTTPGFGEPGGNGARCRLCWPTRWRRRSGCFADLSSPGLQESSGVGHSTPIWGYSFELLPVLGEGATQRQQRNRSKCRFPIRTGYISAISPLPPRLLGAVQRTE